MITALKGCPPLTIVFYLSSPIPQKGMKLIVMRESLSGRRTKNYSRLYPAPLADIEHFSDFLI